MGETKKSSSVSPNRLSLSLAGLDDSLSLFLLSASRVDHKGPREEHNKKEPYAVQLRAVPFVHARKWPVNIALQGSPLKPGEEFTFFKRMENTARERDLSMHRSQGDASSFCTKARAFPLGERRRIFPSIVLLSVIEIK